jgi:hypothetical protein
LDFDVAAWVEISVSEVSMDAEMVIIGIVMGRDRVGEECTQRSAR